KRDGLQVGVRVVGVGVVCEDVYIDRGILVGGGAVAVGDRRVVDGRDRNRDCGCATALGVGDWWRARRAVVTGLVGEGVGRGLAAVVAVAEGEGGVEGHGHVWRSGELVGCEGVGVGVGVVGVDAGGRAVGRGE